METFLEKTRRLVRESGIPHSRICRETSLKRRWLDYVMDGTYKDPSVNKVEELHNFVVLNGRKRKRAA